MERPIILKKAIKLSDTDTDCIKTGNLNINNVVNMADNISLSARLFIVDTFLVSQVY